MLDYAHVLNTYVWQHYELMLDRTKLFKFIEFWQREIDGPFHSVRFCLRKMIRSGEWRNVAGIAPLH